jgi:hypothetical protein
MDTHINISKVLANTEIFPLAGMRIVVAEYELTTPPGIGTMDEVEVRFSLTVLVGEGVSENGQTLGNVNGFSNGT